jgi:3-dehydroquinate synthase
MRLTLNTGYTIAAEIYSGPSVFEELTGWLDKAFTGTESVFILTDTHTRSLCLPLLLSAVPFLQKAEVLEVPAGEKSKSIETAGQLWNALLAKGASRRSLLINLGGGVVTDLGGFVASTFKRGISFIHIPTSLLGMVDAAIGGKTGINSGKVKNQVGTFHSAEAIFIYPGFLKTLDNYELVNGFAEVIKTALVGDLPLWEKLVHLNLQDLVQGGPYPGLDEIIEASVAIKCRIVEQDFRERNLREILNFGHTIGHAFESLSYQKKGKPLSHGHAVALGMICESYLSEMKTGFAAKDRDLLTSMIFPFYEYYPVLREDVGFIMDTMIHDKKRRDSCYRFTLLRGPGNAIPGITCNFSEIEDSLSFYQNIKRD